MSDLSLILLSAGSSSRFDMNIKKHWLRVGSLPLWHFVALKFQKTDKFSQIIIVSSPSDIQFMKNHASYTFVKGGNTRQESLHNALKEVQSEFVLVSDVARACINEEFLARILSTPRKSDSIVPYIKVTDTIVYENETIDREKVKRIQTPQLSRTIMLKKALLLEEEFTDESSAIVAAGGKREFILGDEDAHKITFLKDLHKISCLDAPSDLILSGNGFDVHAFDTKGEMWLGGVKIDSDFGFKAHSDGDVALHSLIDALLGASGMGDIGDMFPDNDAQYENIDSKRLLTQVVTKLHSFGFVITNVDITIMAQQPRIGTYKLAMRQIIANILGIEMSRVNIKATTTEKLGFIGRSEGVAVSSNANLKYFNWKMIG